jgi:hypothetical protein
MQLTNPGISTVEQFDPTHAVSSGALRYGSSPKPHLREIRARLYFVNAESGPGQVSPSWRPTLPLRQTDRQGELRLPPQR